MQEVIKSEGHTEEIIPGKAATCTEDGLTEGKKCTVCGEITVVQEVIKSEGHSEEIVPEKDVTATEPGLTEGKKCSVCGQILVEQQMIYCVVYDGNGSGGSAPAMESGIEGTTLTVAGQGGLVNGNYQFAGWNTRVNGTGIAYQPGSQLTLRGNVTLYAQWRLSAHTVSGTITGHKGVTYTSVTAKLVSTDGMEYIGTVSAGVPDGQKTAYAYSVNAPDGRYDLIITAITDEGVEVTRTHSVNVKGNDTTQQVNLPNGQAKAKSAVVVEEDAPQVLAGGLDQIVDETVAENTEVTAVEVSLVVETVDESSTEAEAIRDQVADTDQKLEFVELTIRKEVTTKSGEVESENVSELNSTVEIVIPFDCTGKTDIKVHRYHGDQVDTLTTTPNVNGEWVELGGDHIVIHSKKFSTYAIGYSAPKHTEEIIPSKAATCTETGLTAGVKCSECGEILVQPEVVPVIDHTEEFISGKEPTLTEDGLTDGKKCAECGEILVEQEEIPALEFVEGACGENLTWRLTREGVLTISGEGAMDNFNDEAAPWSEYAALITVVVIEDGVTSIGDNSFAACEKLVEVKISETVIEIGDGAFSGCDTLETVTYSGSREQWNEIKIGEGNGVLHDKLEIIAIQMGDVTGDGKVNVGDAVKLLKAIASKTTDEFSDEMFKAADVTRDGKLNVGDAVKLLKAIASKTTDEL